VSQTGLASKQRRRNVRGAFTMSHPITQQHVAIFDDVITTGSTVNEMAKTLRGHGVTKIQVWSIARANLEH
ncbi:MAG: ComF family protein, partial [Methylococcales bacterium]